MLLKIFDAEFPYKFSYFEPLCILAKMAAKTVIRPVENKFLFSKITLLHYSFSAKYIANVNVCVDILKNFKCVWGEAEEGWKGVENKPISILFCS